MNLIVKIKSYLLLPVFVSALLPATLFAASFDSEIPENVMFNPADWDATQQGIFVIVFANAGTGITCSETAQAGIPMNTPGADVMVEIALDAFKNRRPLQVYTSGCLDWGTTSNVVPEVTQIRAYSE